MLIFILHVIFCFLSGLITFGLGIFVYTKNPESSTNRLFLAVMLAATYWAFGEFFIWTSGGYDGSLFWLRASALWPFAVVLTFHFVLDFTRHAFARPENSWFLISTLYIPATIFSLFGILTDLTFTIGFQPDIGYIYMAARDSPVYQLESLYVVLLMIWAAYATCISWRNSKPGKIRRQNRLVFLSIMIVIFFGAISGIILPYYQIATPNFVFIGIVIFSLIITYASLRYGLFTLSPETAAREIIQLMPDGMILADRQGRIITANVSAGQIFGVPEHELPGKPVAAYLKDPDCTSIRQTLLDKHEILDYEAVIGPRNEISVSIAGSVITDPAGEPAGFILMIRDITSRKESEKALLDANKKISLLNQLTRHDISNLVTALGGYLVLIQEKKHDPDEESFLAVSLGIVEKITRHLQFSREYQEIGTNQPVWQSLKTMVDRAARDLLPGNVAITSTIPPLEIRTDPLAIKAFYNIFENAIRHGKKVTSIRVMTEIPSSELIIVIEDDGIGIPDADKEHIFRYDFGKNTGLGLALSRDILLVTGITITETGIPDNGARFEIHVPTTGWRYGSSS